MQLQFLVDARKCSEMGGAGAANHYGSQRSPRLVRRNAHAPSKVPANDRVLEAFHPPTTKPLRRDPRNRSEGGVVVRALDRISRMRPSPLTAEVPKTSTVPPLR